VGIAGVGEREKKKGEKRCGLFPKRRVVKRRKKLRGKKRKKGGRKGSVSIGKASFPFFTDGKKEKKQKSSLTILYVS